jgi:hypothetical protein
MNEVRFTYKTKTALTIFIIFVLALISFIFVQVALDNDAGLGYRSIELSVNGATIFYWFISGLFLIFTLFWLKGFLMGRSKNREIILDETSISSPKSGLSKKIVKVKYSDITGVSVGDQSGHVMLNIFHSGNTLIIPKAMLPDEKSFNELIDLIKERVEMNKV